MIVEIKGVQFVNKGAELMLRVIVDRLATLLPGIEFAVAPGPNSPHEKIIKAGAMLRLRVGASLGAFDRLTDFVPRRAQLLLRRYGTVTESDLDGVIDASGYAYSSIWGDHAMIQTAREIDRFAARGKPYIFMPQAFGPFTAGPAVTHFSAALRRAALVCARDPDSQRALAQLPGGPAPALRLFPDFTTTAESRSSPSDRRQIDRQIALVVPNVEMTGARNTDDAWRAQYLDVMTAACDEAAKLGYTVRVLNHEGARDQELCERLAAAAGLGPVIVESDPLALRGVIGAAGLLIGSRFHACVAALSQGVPCVGTSWSHKYRHLFADYGVEPLLVVAPDVTAMRRIVRQTVSDTTALREVLRARQLAIAERSEEMWRAVLVALRSASISR